MKLGSVKNQSLCEVRRPRIGTAAHILFGQVLAPHSGQLVIVVQISFRSQILKLERHIIKMWEQFPQINKDLFWCPTFLKKCCSKWEWKRNWGQSFEKGISPLYAWVDPLDQKAWPGVSALLSVSPDFLAFSLLSVVFWVYAQVQLSMADKVCQKPTENAPQIFLHSSHPKTFIGTSYKMWGSMQQKD